ncbi:MAG TPA: response regulator transcription factor [Mycobacteriales bacterium]|nr:response regulator transcription factor [Mycobacteriales bacterium]
MTSPGDAPSPPVRRVLLVEDDPAVRDGLAVVLEIEPDLLLVGTASSGQEAVERMRALEPDVVLLDNHLEGPMTGVQVAPALKAIAPTAVVLMCTSDPGDLAQDEPAIDGCLCKDSLAVLPDAVRQLLGKA